MINYHGLTIKGIKSAAGETKSCSNGYGAIVEIFYDLDEGEVWGKYHADANNWTVYHDANIIRVAVAGAPMTMQQIADAVADAVEWLRLSAV